MRLMSHLAERVPHAARRVIRVLAASLVVASGVTAHAHEIGTTRVVAAMGQADTYSIVLTTDADTLLARLESARALPTAVPTTIAEFEQRFAVVCQDVVRHIGLAFDGEPATSTGACAIDSSDVGSDLRVTPPGVVVTFTGHRPSSATTFTWRYDLTYASYALVVEAAEGEPAKGNTTVWLDGGDDSGPMPMLPPRAAPSRATVARTYFVLGFTHILPKGLDHILFVLGIFLLSRRWRPMLWQVSAFTLAHTLTLGLTMYGLVAVPASVVEPLIAASIVYLAVENLLVTELQPRRVALVFAFGLLHGMGFAGVLSELALPRAEFVTGLTAFNVGVEAGQLTVLAAAALSVLGWRRHRDSYRRWIVVPASCAIGVVGLFWMVQRLAA
ncbi:MAG: HupE/UreJ family protein [Vicinamibacterales bacterium]